MSARAKFSSASSGPPWSGARLPQGRLDALLQLGLLAIAYCLYRLVRGLVYEGQVATAFENARTLVRLEQGMGLFFEPGLQAWALGSPWLVWAASLAYLKSHFVVTAAFFTWLYLARNGAFYYVRNTFLVSMAIGMSGYAAFPTAPPRLLSGWGFAHTVATLVGAAAVDGVEALCNPFAAVPSMHVAFALLVAAPALMLVRRPALKVAWAVYPVIVTLVVMITGNHFWLDVALGALVAAASAGAAHLGLGRAWPEAWGWHDARRAEAAA